MKAHCIAYPIKLQLHDAIYRLRFYSNSLVHILSLSNLHNNVASIQKNQANKSHRVIVALDFNCSCDKPIIAIVSCLKTFHKSESKLILSITASFCKISSSKMVNYYFSFGEKHGSLTVMITSIVLSFNLCMTTVYIVSLNTNTCITKIGIRLYIIAD